MGYVFLFLSGFSSILTEKYPLKEIKILYFILTYTFKIVKKYTSDKKGNTK